VSGEVPGRQRDLRAEQDHAEWLGWAEANGYGNEYERDFGHDDMRDAFTAGMEAVRMLAGVNDPAYGTLRARITRLAETWEGHAELTEEGQILRDLGQVLRDELGRAGDTVQEPHAVPVSPDLACARCGPAAAVTPGSGESAAALALVLKILQDGTQSHASMVRRAVAAIERSGVTL